VNGIQKKIIHFSNLRRKSISHCLLVLGAPRAEVYHSGNDRRLRTPHNASSRSIYDDYTRQELLEWAEHLYVDALKRYHPDKHPENPRLYTEICQELSKAYLRARKILNGGK
jgi:hypothetical protein